VQRGPGSSVPRLVMVAAMAAAAVGMEVVGMEVVVVAEAVVAWTRRAGAVRAPDRCSSLFASGHRGTLPCLRRGSSSRLVANIRSPATSF